MAKQLKLSPGTLVSTKPQISHYPRAQMVTLSESEPEIESPQPSSPSSSGSQRKKRSWCVYLLASTNSPFKTYVGVTNDFSRRLKQHNGELKGGAKACRTGRPWVCACIVQGFGNQSEACEFESKWKRFSKKFPSNRKQENEDAEENDDRGLLLLLQRRHAAMEKLEQSFVYDHLQVDWKIRPS